MSWRRYLALSLFGLAVCTAAAAFQNSPGYMDADYYLLGGLQLARGSGFHEPVLWNFLAEPTGLPHPSHGYWMPLASILAWIGLEATGELSFAGGRVMFLLLGALVPPLTAGLAWRITGRSGSALLAGALAAFPAFYLPFLTTTDTFGLYMVLGGTYFLVLGHWVDNRPSTSQTGYLAAGGLGVLAGLMHFSRADGLLWLAVTWLAFLLAAWRMEGRGFTNLAVWVGLSALGYSLVMGPWIVRNLQEFGTPLSPGGLRALWLRDYDDLFAYPPQSLTPQRWLEAGWGALVGHRSQALSTNLGNVLAVQGQIFLLPLILLGAWRRRADLRVQVAGLAWGATFLAMSLIFPFPGARGGFFHSGAAVQPLLWALVPDGLEAFIAWGMRRRNWRADQARQVFGLGLVLLAAGMTFLSVSRRIIAGNPRAPAWDASSRQYAQLEQILDQKAVAEGEVVLVNNPPGYFLASGRSAVVIPNGGLDTLLQVAQRYQASYVLLEPNHPRALRPVYENPFGQPGLAFVARQGGNYWFKVTE